MNEIMTTVFGLAGGLAMFLFGMNSMSDALQKAAGERMKQILSDAAAGYFGYLRREHRHDDDRPADGV